MESPRYEITRLLGKGRTGGVYEALDHASGATVAMRRFFYSETGETTDWLGAFHLLSADALELDAPNLVRVLNYDIDEDGPYLIEELVEGYPLTKLLTSEETLSFEAFHHLITELLGCLITVHSSGQLHNGLGPNSVFVCEQEGQALRLKLGDLVLYELCDYLSQKTGEPNRFLNLPMTAPEVLRGDQPSIRTDLYAFGHLVCSLWLQGHTYVGMSAEEILGHIHKGHALDVKISERPLPKGFNAWLNRLMHPNPQERPHSALEALETLPGADGQLSSDPKIRAVQSLETKLVNVSPVASPQASIQRENQSGFPKAALGIAALLLISLVAVFFMLPSDDDAETPDEQVLPDPSVTTGVAFPEDYSQEPATTVASKTPTTPTPAQKVTPPPPVSTVQPAPKPKLKPAITRIPTKPSPPVKPSISENDHFRFKPTLMLSNYRDIDRVQLDLKQEKHYAWYIFSDADHSKGLRGGEVSEIIQVKKTSPFATLASGHPRILYSTEDGKIVPAAMFAHVRQGLTVNQGFHILIKVPSWHPEDTDLMVRFEAQANFCDLAFKASYHGETSPIQHPVAWPRAAINASQQNPAQSTYFPSQVLVIKNAQAGKTVLVECLVSKAYQDSRKLHSVGLGAISIWRE